MRHRSRFEERFLAANRRGIPFLALAFVAAASASEVLALEPPRLVADLSTYVYARGSNPHEMHRIGERIVFAASDPLYGNELRGIGADLQGLELLVDATPGTLDSSVRFVGEIGGALAYLVGEGSYPRLFVTDGTTAGTRLVRTGDGAAVLTQDVGWYTDVVVSGERLYWAGKSSTSFARGLWVVAADGVATLLHSLELPARYFDEHRIEGLRAVGARVFFQDVDSFDRGQIWVMDGTPGGTRRVTDQVEAYDWFAAATEDLYFFEGWNGDRYAIWSTDGTEQGTRLLREWQVEGFSGGLSPFVDGSRRIYFFAGSDSDHPVWMSDGTVSGTVPVELDVGDPWYGGTYHVWLGEDLVFSSPNGSLWAHDGQATAARPLTLALPDGRPWHGPMTLLGDLLLFSVDDAGGEGYQIWRTDGTATGTFQVSNFEPGEVRSGSGQGHDAGGVAVFNLDEYCNSLPPLCSWIPFVTDGTPGGSRILGGELEVAFGYDGNAAVCREGLLVQGYSRASLTGVEPWLVRLPEGSARPVANLEPEIGSTTFGALHARGEGLLFEVWDWDGEASLLAMADGQSQPHALPEFGLTWPDLLAVVSGGALAAGYDLAGYERLLTLADDDSGWRPLPATLDYSSESVVVTDGSQAYVRQSVASPTIWRSDGTDEGTWALLVPGLPAYVQPVAATQTHLLMREGYLPTIWYGVSTQDGALEQLLEESGPTRWGLGGEVAATDDLSYFTTPELGSVEVLRYSDGTAAGTGVSWTSRRDERVLDLYPVGEDLYFLAASDRLGLWRTRAGEPATLVADLGSLARYADDEEACEGTVVEGRLWFVAETAATGRELWSSDGTAEGTAVVDLVPGPVGSDPRWLASIGNRLFFSADDTYFGREVWSVAEGWPEPIRVSDIAAGPASAAPEKLTAAGSTLYFAADDGVHGRELWAIDSGGDAIPCQADGSHLCLLEGRYEVEAFWRDFEGRSGAAWAMPLTDASGFFWFFDEEGIDLAVKMVDACGFDGFDDHWFYATGLTNVEVTLAVLDTFTLERHVLHNPLGTAFPPTAETSWFRSCGPLGERASRSSAGRLTSLASLSPGTCEPGIETLCLRDGRFEVTLGGTVPGQGNRAGRAVPLSEGSGYFTFFGPENVEAVVRVIDGCGENGRYWLFAGGLTDLSTRLTVRDTLHPEAEIVRSTPGGEPFAPLLAIDAFSTCP